MAIEPSRPVIIGVAEYVDKDSTPAHALSPLDMLEHVALAALHDSGARGLAQHITDISVVRTFFDSTPAYQVPGVAYSNLPKSLAARLGSPAAGLTYPHVGGNTPQYQVNVFAERLAAGEGDIVLLAGAEAMRTFNAAQRQGYALDWREETGDVPEVIGDGTPGVNPHELAHGIGVPVSTYPLYENAIGHAAGRSPQEQRAFCGEVFAPFSHIAAQNPYAAFPIKRSASELATPTAENRTLAYPYTKFMVAQMYVDQASAVIMTTYGRAKELGVAEDKIIHLHGCADTKEKWFISERTDYHSSPAMRVGSQHAFDMAGKTAGDMALFDLYSCFPSAVEVACDALDLSHDDPRGLTVTGGLPFFGGPGNNYTMHAIATMVSKLRQRRDAFGYVTGNGWYLTKHSFGIYSAAAPEGPFERVSPARYQSEIDGLQSPAFTETPQGEGTVKTYTVVYKKMDPIKAILIGRQKADGARFLAVSRDPAMMAEMIDAPVIGREISVTQGDKANTAHFTR
ncbi:MAG: acetyl-CoA acetyltransferase [Pseudomonadota bacterium]